MSMGRYPARCFGICTFSPLRMLYIVKTKRMLKEWYMCIRMYVIFMLLCACGLGMYGSGFSRGGGYWTTPADEARTDVFGRLMDVQSQRENWYTVTPYIAELWCTLSNAGFLYVAYRHSSWETAVAGLASAASHAIPRQWLHTADMLGIATVLTKVARNYHTIRRHPSVIACGAIAGIVNRADAYLARTYGWTWPHVLWHLTAAGCIDYFLSSIE